ncbi:DUF427 domain-containing protein [Afifella marina DSM 2698]|nr:DUF427 domain-containing protein [Afifella marina DSM 2698]MBK1625790.1 DUF427 domain-containing protein [Afifella marina]MBK5917613.1 hypothetical protein [Afifella marina]RAI23540.1 hypothetical protein CH311_01275 [Afifella marina DSM 2698]
MRLKGLRARLGGVPMPHKEYPITFSVCSGLVTVRLGDLLLARTSRAVIVSEAGRSDVIYIPRLNVRMAHMQRSEKLTTCPHKGAASYYSLMTDKMLVPDIAWSYENPYPAISRIAHYLAFDPKKVEIEMSDLPAGDADSEAFNPRP